MRKDERFPLLHSSFLLQTFPIIWHTTGSGKTLTSFKASTLLKDNTAALVRRLLSEDYADKVIVTTIQKLGLAMNDLSE